MTERSREQRAESLAWGQESGDRLRRTIIRSGGQRESSLSKCTSVKAGRARRYLEGTNLERKAEGIKKEGWEEEN